MLLFSTEPCCSLTAGRSQNGLQGSMSWMAIQSRSSQDIWASAANKLLFLAGAYHLRRLPMSGSNGQRIMAWPGTGTRSIQRLWLLCPSGLLSESVRLAILSHKLKSNIPPCLLLWPESPLKVLTFSRTTFCCYADGQLDCHDLCDRDGTSDNLKSFVSGWLARQEHIKLYVLLTNPQGPQLQFLQETVLESWRYIILQDQTRWLHSHP